MRAWQAFHNRIVAALVLLFVLCGPAAAQTAKLDDLFGKLLTADATASVRIEEEIWIEWSKSGSPAMDLLLQRGRQAMEEGYPDVAINHFSALIDHAPDFAEGWNARAIAYFQLGQFGPAVSDIAHVLRLNPRHFGALAGLGSIFEELGKPQKALEVYRAALAIHPHMTQVLDAVKRLEADTQGQNL